MSVTPQRLWLAGGLPWLASAGCSGLLAARLASVRPLVVARCWIEVAEVLVGS